MSGFTKDAWAHDGLSVVARGRGIIAICPTPQSGGVMQCADNAVLIAAAPELYGQLESAQTDLDLLRRAIEENDPKAELLIRVTDLWKRNEAALAKVRGKQ